MPTQRDPLCYDTAYSRRKVETFRKNILRLSSGQNWDRLCIG